MNHTHSNSHARGEKPWLGRIWKVLTDLDRPPLYFVLAFLFTLTVEVLSRRSLTAALLFLVKSPLAFLTNYAIILLTLLLSLIIPKRLAGLALTSAIWLVLGVAQCIVLMMRVTPLSAVDIAMVFSVITIITAYLTPWQFALICVTLVGVVAGIVILFIRTRRHTVRWKCFILLYLSVLLLSVGVTVAGFATGQLSDKFPNLATAYNDYGFPYCFSMSVVDKGVNRPDDYEDGLISDILDELSTESDSALPGNDPTGKAPNVIMVQLESFFDVKYMENVTYTSDPIPTFTALKEQYPSGLLNVPVIGAGTINTEFEVLTGINVDDFGAGEYPFRTIIKDTTCETIAYDLLASGYRTHAIHNHQGSFYLRNEIYKNLGFETFTSIEYFEKPEFNENDWARDIILTDEILYLLNSTEESDFVFAVSVQGHGKYPDEYTPAEDDILITGGIEDETVRSHYQYYINQLNEMDTFIRELYEAVMAMEEDTVLVFYGDHLPSIARDEGIRLTTSEFQTEYIIISNYDAPAPSVTGELSTYELFPLVMEMLGNDEGVMNRFHRAYRNQPDYLEKLAALEYDVLYGDRIAYGGDTYPVMDLVMGSRPIEVTGCYRQGDFLYIKGTGFTPYSVVAIDGKEQETAWINSSTLQIPWDSDWDRGLQNAHLEVTVRQITAKGDLLSETRCYRYTPYPSGESQR